MALGLGRVTSQKVSQSEYDSIRDEAWIPMQTRNSLRPACAEKMQKHCKSRCKTVHLARSPPTTYSPFPSSWSKVTMASESPATCEARMVQVPL